MRSIIIALLLTCSAGATFAAEASYNEEFTRLLRGITNQLVGGSWEVIADPRCIILIRRDVRFLYRVSLPLGATEQQLWEKYSVESDYTMTISLEAELTQDEYGRLVALRDRAVASFLRGRDPQTKEYAAASRRAESLVRLPQYRWKGRSLFIHSGLLEGAEMRPALVEKQRAKVMALLDRTCSKYTAGNSEPTAPRNGGSAKSPDTPAVSTDRHR